MSSRQLVRSLAVKVQIHWSLRRFRFGCRNVSPNLLEPGPLIHAMPGPLSNDAKTNPCCFGGNIQYNLVAMPPSLLGGGINLGCFGALTIRPLSLVMILFVEMVALMSARK